MFDTGGWKGRCLVNQRHGKQVPYRNRIMNQDKESTPCVRYGRVERTVSSEPASWETGTVTEQNNERSQGVRPVCSIRAEWSVLLQG